MSKKDGRLRIVVDCRRSNELNLATAGVLSRVDLAGHQGEIYIATADLKDAFYHFESPVALRRYFGMRTVAAGEVGVTVVSGRSVRSAALFYPRVRDFSRRSYNSAAAPIIVGTRPILACHWSEPSTPGGRGRVGIPFSVEWASFLGSSPEGSSGHPQSSATRTSNQKNLQTIELPKP